MNDMGLKELVKAGKLTAKDAMNRLWAKADPGMGGTGHAILRKRHTLKWLAKK